MMSHHWQFFSEDGVHLFEGGWELVNPKNMTGGSNALRF